MESEHTRSTPALPSITDLGRIGAILNAEYQRLSGLLDANKASEADRNDLEPRRTAMDIQERLNLIYRQEEALRQLICTLRQSPSRMPQSSSGLPISSPRGKDPDADEQEWREACIERITISALPVIIAAGGIDAVALNLDQFTELHEARFPSCGGTGH